MEEDQLQPALTRTESHLRFAGLLQLGIAQTPQLHLNTQMLTCQTDVVAVGGEEGGEGGEGGGDYALPKTTSGNT